MITRFFRLILSLPSTAGSHSRYRKLFKAMRRVETGGERTPWAVGDHGRAIGPYRLSHGYWLDAYRYDRTLGGTWPMVVDRRYAEATITAYWNKHASMITSWEQLARIHKGGPQGHGKPETAKYWSRVNAAL